MTITQGAAQDAKVRASLTSKGDVWVGQRVTLVVELLAPGFFAGAPSFDLPDPKGLLLVPPRGSPTVGSEDIDGISYAVQRHELSVFAQRAGAQTIPPLTVRFHFKRAPLDKEIIAATIHTAAMSFVAKAPPGAEKLGSIISARNLTAVEKWEPEPGRAKAGDAFTRIITFAAPDVPAMAFPPFRTGSIEGMGIYPKAPELIDHDERGVIRGERRDTLTYLCQRPGRFVIPAARLTWWDLERQEIQTVEFPARTIDVAPNPAMASAATAQAPVSSRQNRHLFAGLLAAIGVNVVALLLWKTRVVWRPSVAAFRPVHLAPLNPGQVVVRESPSNQ